MKFRRESLRGTTTHVWSLRQATQVVLNQGYLCDQVMVELQACNYSTVTTHGVNMQHRCELLACYFHVLSVRWQLIVRWLIPHVPLLCWRVRPLHPSRRELFLLAYLPKHAEKKNTLQSVLQSGVMQKTFSLLQSSLLLLGILASVRVLNRPVSSFMQDKWKWTAGAPCTSHIKFTNSSHSCTLKMLRIEGY